MSRILGIGVIGCGEAGQILHIPALKDLPDKFAIAAICDASRAVVDGVGIYLPAAARYTDASELLEDNSVDAVVVANPNGYHASTAIEAMNRGKHVLIEKPMCMSLREADALAEAEARTGMTVQVGYMRRYAPAFEEAVRIIEPLRDRINLARVHDVLGSNASIIRSTTAVVRGEDIPPQILEAGRRGTEAKLLEAIGTAEQPRAAVYSLLLGLSTHDLSAMRELLGVPKSVLYAAHRCDGRFISAAFDFGGFVCQFETGVDSIARFDAHIEVYTRDKVVRVEYDTPYVRHQPARLTVTAPNTVHGVSSTAGYQSRRDSFVIEWERFYEAILGGSVPKTSIADAREDLELVVQMMASM